MTAAFAKSFGRICRRSHGRIVDLSLSRVSLVGEPLESAIQWQGNSLFCSHRNKRRRMNDRLFPFVSKGRSAIRRTRHSGWRRGDHGDRGYFVFSRSAVVAAAPWRHARDCRLFLLCK
jgi:hypothetical protein